jgi:O-antigen/teichoic acid export membrane protein
MITTARVRSAMDVPLLRNAYALMSATMTTAVVGLVFWIIAARTYPTSTVGTNGALISTTMLLSNFAQLNLVNGINRFVPVAGVATRRLVLTGYAASVLVAGAGALVFLAGVRWWSPSLAFLRDDSAQSLWFVVAAMLWTIFALQDAVLTGLGAAHWVLVENVVYGVLKLVLVAVLAVALPDFGVYLAWTVPLIALIVPITHLLLRRLIPERQHRPLEPLAVRGIVRFLSLDYMAGLFTTGTNAIVTLVVLAVAGPRASAYVYLGSTIAYTLRLLSMNVGMAFVTEAAQNPSQLAEHARHALQHAVRLVGALACFVVIAAPLLLRVFGADYAANATHMLQLSAMAAVPYAIVVVFLSIARVQRRMGAVVLTAGVHAIGVVGLTAVLLPPIGITAVGIAWLTTETALATVVYFTQLRPLLAVSRQSLSEAA